MIFVAEAISASDAGLTHEDIWKLLQAGTSDVHMGVELQEPASSIVARFERWSTIEQLGMYQKPLSCLIKETHVSPRNQLTRSSSPATLAPTCHASRLTAV